MKSITTTIGLILILLGILTFVYQGFTYTKQEKVAQLGDLNVTTSKQETVHFPPLLGGLSLAVGIVLVVVGRRK